MPRTKTLTEIKIANAKKFRKDIKNINQLYRGRVMSILARNLDHIRHTAADDYIIKNIVGHNKSPWRMAKEQLSHPSKLTERTGRLLTMIRHDKKWQGIKNKVAQTNASAVQRTMGLNNRIVTDKAARNINEAYTATVRAHIALGNPFIGKGFVGGGRIITVVNGKPIRVPGKKETRQTLHARFLHEHGLRGVKRQAFTPATQDEQINLKRLFESRLSRILKVKDSYVST